MPFADYEDFADCVAKNQDKDDPEAYCAVIKEQVEGRAAEFRHLTLRVAGKARKQVYNGREHYVVPVVALMEGVIHAVNAQTPEFVPFSTLSTNVDQWNGRPLMLGHPVKDGMHIAANTPSVLEAQAFGSIFNARVDPVKRRLLVDAFVDPERLKQLNRLDVLQSVEEGGIIEVSIGAFVGTDSKPGTFNGKPYKASWKALGSDHLAFLPDSRGACSVEMGCGAHRAASENDVIEMSDDTLVVLHGKYKDCPMCQGSGSHNGNPCEACDGTGELRIASEGDTDMDRKKLIDKLTSCACSGFTTAHLKMLEAATDDQLVTFVAASDFAFKKKEEEDEAEKKKKADMKAAEDAKRSLEDKVTALQVELRAAADKQLTEDEYLRRAPDSIRTLVADKRAQDDTERVTLVASLKTAAASVYSEDELIKKELPELRKLAALAKVDVDYSGRGIPSQRTTTAAVDYTPPNPYEVGIKAMQARH